MEKIQVHKAYSFKEAEAFDEKFWQKAGAAWRFSATWLMVGEWLKMRGKGGTIPRLRRTIRIIKRK